MGGGRWQCHSARDASRGETGASYQNGGVLCEEIHPRGADFSATCPNLHEDSNNQRFITSFGSRRLGRSPGAMGLRGTGHRRSKREPRRDRVPDEPDEIALRRASRSRASRPTANRAQALRFPSPAAVDLTQDSLIESWSPDLFPCGRPPLLPPETGRRMNSPAAKRSTHDERIRKRHFSVSVYMLPSGSLPLEEGGGLGRRSEEESQRGEAE